MKNGRGGSVLLRLRDSIASRFLASLWRATHRATSELRRVFPARVLVVAPHMDDEVIPCGGTLLLHRERGSTLHVVFVSDSAGPSTDPAYRRSLATTRTAEMVRVQELVGYQSTEVYGFPDGRLMRHEREIADKLVATIEAFKPDLIFCPFPADAHRDHQATAIAVTDAARRARWNGSIWAYEVWTALWPNAAIDITAVAEAKEQAVCAYVSQLDDRDYAGAVLGLNRFRGMRHNVKFAEAFYVCTPRQFANLTVKLNELP